MAKFPKKIDISAIGVGDTITAVSDDNLYPEVKVVRVDDDGSFYSECLGFDPIWGWKYYLIERPKKPLPKSIGSVVEVDGVKYVRVLEDSKWHYEWAKSVEGYTFGSVSSEYLADLDYTVV